MGFLDLFAKKKAEVNTYQQFWDWFLKNRKDFHDAVKNETFIERDFSNKISPKLNDVKGGFYFLSGMFDKNTVELIITVDGKIKNFVFVEELVAAAPKMEGWKFTALKPASSIENVNIQMGAYQYTGENLHFFANNDDRYPDEIDITVVYDNFKDDDRRNIINGIFIFLDNYLGELELATIVDAVKFGGRENFHNELIPIEKLKAFLNWREKEFVEKYEGTRHHTENDSHSLLEAELENGHPLIAVINTELLKWNAKASHPWILDVEIKFDGRNQNGMPDKTTAGLLDEIEEKLMEQLIDHDGFLNIGRETADSIRNIYFACKDFRKPSLVTDTLVQLYKDRVIISYDIYKDKYWRSFNRFMIT